MGNIEVIKATSGGSEAAFTVDWYARRWTSAVSYDMSDFPFIAEVAGKRYELYGDGTFDEEERSRNQ